MKKNLLTATALCIGLFTQAQNGLDSIIVEKYYVATAVDSIVSDANSGGTLRVGAVTYRVFVDLATGDSLQAVYGDANHTMLVNTTTSFFNNEDRGKEAGDKVGSQYLKNSTVALDSWFSMGGTAVGQIGVLKADDDGVANMVHTGRSDGALTSTVSVAIPLTTQDGMIAGSPKGVSFVGTGSAENTVLGITSQAGNSFSVNNGSVYFSPSNGSSGVAGPTPSTNRVLIGQFTTEGTLHFELNLQIKKAGGAIEKWVSSNPQGGEYTHASLTYTSPAPPSGSNASPTVSVTAPSGGATYAAGASVAITAGASDTDGTVDSVEFYVDGVKVGSDLSSPYSYNWNITAGTHTITAVATDDGGAQTTSSGVVVTGTTTGIGSQSSVGNGYVVYPNPTAGSTDLEITTSRATRVAYQVYDLIGNLILEKNIGIVNGVNNQHIDLSSFSSGLYMLKVSMDNSVYTLKIIKN